MGVCFEDMWLLPGDSESIKPSSSGGVAPNYFEQGRSANTSAGKGTTPRAQETIEGAGFSVPVPSFFLHFNSQWAGFLGARVSGFELEV